jgi:hypothetical protein
VLKTFYFLNFSKLRARSTVRPNVSPKSAQQLSESKKESELKIEDEVIHTGIGSVQDLNQIKSVRVYRANTMGTSQPPVAKAALPRLSSSSSNVTDEEQHSGSSNPPDYLQASHVNSSALSLKQTGECLNKKSANDLADRGGDSMASVYTGASSRHSVNSKSSTASLEDDDVVEEDDEEEHDHDEEEEEGEQKDEIHREPGENLKLSAVSSKSAKGDMKTSSDSSADAYVVKRVNRNNQVKKVNENNNKEELMTSQSEEEEEEENQINAHEVKDEEKSCLKKSSVEESDI